VPEPAEIPKVNRIISPSISSNSVADEEDERYDRSRQVLSPSPEVDLSSPELEDEDSRQPPTPGAPFSARNSVPRERSASAATLLHNRRAASPQLEHEERDFKQTASALHEQAQQRRNSQLSQEDVDMETADAVAGAEQEPVEVTASIEDSEETAALKQSQAAEVLFGHTDHLKPAEHQIGFFSSPVIEPQSEVRVELPKSPREKLGEPMQYLSLEQNHQISGVAMLDDWEALQSPENICVAQLEAMFDDY